MPTPLSETSDGMSVTNVDTSPAIELDGVSMVFQMSKGQPTHALDHIDLTVSDGEFVTVVGSSGCGKSTMLNLAAGLIEPTSGRVLVHGEMINGPGRDRSMVFQEDAVFPWYTVKRNIEYGLKVAKLSPKQIDERVNRFLEITKLEDYALAYPRELSGGMRKRVDVARATVVEPEILLMDEPFAALDALTKQDLQVALLDIWGLQKMTIVFVTHDIEEALFMSDRVVMMSPRPGRIKQITKVPFERPRVIELKTDPLFQDMRRELLMEL